MKALIAIDDSEDSRAAVSFADELLDEEDESVVLNVVQPTEHALDNGSGTAGVGLATGPAGHYLPPYPANSESARLSSRIARGDAQRRAHAVAKALDPERVLVRFGNPARQICSTAEALDVDLIVLGTRDAGVLKRLLTGSVSRKVLDKAKCPVLVVRG